MNKQELIDKLNKQLTTPSKGTDFDYGHDYGIQRAIYLAEDLDEQQAPISKPEKPVVPKFVADWVEWCKKNKITLLGADTAICSNRNIRSLDASGWAMKNQETFAKAWLYGYEIEKEKLYTVKVLDSTLFKITSDNHVRYKLIGENAIPLESKIGNYTFEVNLTEKEIKEADERLWQWAKEVE